MSTSNLTAEAALVIRRTFAVPRERVYDAWTKPEILRRWMAPGDMTIREVRFDAREGGKYRIVMVHPEGELYVVGGTIRELRPPERVSYTWQWEGDDGLPEGNETVLTLDFHDRGESTELVLTHTNFTNAESRERHEGGWTLSLEKLGGILDSAPRVRIAGIDLSGYMCKDAQRAIGFYRDVFGLEPAIVYPGGRGAEYELPDGTTFGLWGGGGGVMPFQPSNGILFAVDDLDEAVAALEARGIAVEMNFETPVCRMAMIRDTEGNTVTVHQRKTA